MPLGTIGQYGFDLEAFIALLEYHMGEVKINAPRLSKRAGLNPRAVRDIQERRVESPRVKTVFALEAALNLAPGTLLGLGRERIHHDLETLLIELDEVTQQKLLETLVKLRQR